MKVIWKQTMIGMLSMMLVFIFGSMGSNPCQVLAQGQRQGAGCPYSQGKGMGGAGMLNKIASFPKQALSETEKEGLLEMREEEKLAHDVYITLYEKWNAQIFSDISRSEQRHMAAIKALLDKYGIKDPTTSNEVGHFSNPKYSKLYKDLVEQGSSSLVAALTVGATIEDLDIADLKMWLQKTDNQDIQFVYNRLLMGSRNHIRAFSRNLASQGASYQPKYISTQEYQQILRSLQ